MLALSFDAKFLSNIYEDHKIISISSEILTKSEGNECGFEHHWSRDETRMWQRVAKHFRNHLNLGVYILEMKNLVTVSIDRRRFLSAYANYASVLQLIYPDTCTSTGLQYSICHIPYCYTTAEVCKQKRRINVTIPVVPNTRRTNKFPSNVTHR